MAAAGSVAMLRPSLKTAIWSATRNRCASRCEIRINEARARHASMLRRKRSVSSSESALVGSSSRKMG